MSVRKPKAKRVQGKRIREGMKVKVIAGNEKGQTGTVLRRTNDRVVIQGVNVRKKHVKRSQENPQGGILDIEAALHISNVAPCTEAGEPVKLKVRSNADGLRELVYSQDGSDVLYRPVKKSK